MKLDELHQYPFNTTLLGVLKGVLDYYGIMMSPAKAFGGSGHAFLVNIHEQICPSSPYCWNYQPFFDLVRNLGVEMLDLGFFDARSTPDQRAAVEHKLRGNLDQKIPCALGNMENQLIVGYDDRQFLVAQPWPGCAEEITPRTLTFGTWAEFKDEVHVNFYVFKKVPAQDDRTVFRASLDYALDLARNPAAHALEHYAAGPLAYDNWTRAVQAGHGSSHGNWWNAQVWSECRAMAADYFEEIAVHLPELAAPARELSDDYRAVADLLKKVSDKELAAEPKLALLGEARDREARATGKVAALAARISTP